MDLVAENAENADRWVLRPVRRRAGRIRLLCLPYAGGSAAVFHGWGDLLPEAVEPWAVRLPGRDARMGEPPATDLRTLAAEAAEAVAGLLGDEPFALFGHSLGAYLAYEMARALRDKWDLHPSLLAVSASHAPRARVRAGAPLHRLPDEEFLEALDTRYGAIPPVIREDRQLRAVYLPILRADVTMLETYEYLPGIPLACPVLAFGGSEDRETSRAGLAAWGELTGAGSSVALLPGGHFFLQPERERLLSLLAPELLRTLVP
ncbi:thioesterase II family protein [Streptomyces sp. NBC_01439]|uniref:thioesterase II family protein n=1 Tax=Streptomyces sp. NBC_01439 TaxID=2903867 RepID=UPI002E29ED9C|nr:alpha/beta fold hydrolase [Streptomyces sp. NBC_01439]